MSLSPILRRRCILALWKDQQFANRIKSPLSVGSRSLGSLLHSQNEQRKHQHGYFSTTPRRRTHLDPTSLLSYQSWNRMAGKLPLWPYIRSLVNPRQRRGLSFSATPKTGGETEVKNRAHGCAVMGRRPHMEDTFVILSEEEQPVVAAVFDGHGGALVSKYLEQNLHDSLMNLIPELSSLSQVESPDKCVQLLETALNDMDSHVLSQQKMLSQGSTAVVAWLHRQQHEQNPTSDRDDTNNSTNETGQTPGTLVLANIGDSRAVLGRVLKFEEQNAQGRKSSNEQVLTQTVALTRDHTPEDPEEKTRIESIKGGKVVSSIIDVPRVQGVWAMSRAIGDGDGRPYISATPEFSSVQLSGAGPTPLVQSDDEAKNNDEKKTSADNSNQMVSVMNEFVILATDGLFEAMTNSQAVDLVAAHEWAGTPRKDIPGELTKAALTMGSYDNITVVILWMRDIDDFRKAKNDCAQGTNPMLRATSPVDTNSFW